jgi:hypothetical protein
MKDGRSMLENGKSEGGAALMKMHCLRHKMQFLNFHGNISGLNV